MCINNIKYYTSEKYISDLFDMQCRSMGLNAETGAEYVIWKKKVREKLKEISGMNLMRKSELLPKLVENIQMDGYTRKKVIIQTEPEIWMPLYVLIPDGLKEGEKRPAIITPHGHGSGGKYAVAGNVDYPGIQEQIDKYNYDYGLEFVKHGYIVFCSDARAAGERREAMQQGESAVDILSTSCFNLNNAAISLGQSLIGMMTWDLIRLIDYIETLNYCDSEKIACAGFSGGGLQTLWLAALDERVKCSVVSGYFHGFKGTILKTNLCGCNYVPELWKYVDIGDIGALIAPRPLFVESGSEDKLNGERGLADVNEQLEITKCAYKLLQKETAFYHHIFEGGHMWHGKKSYDFVDIWAEEMFN